MRRKVLSDRHGKPPIQEVPPENGASDKPDVLGGKLTSCHNKEFRVPKQNQIQIREKGYVETMNVKFMTAEDAVNQVIEMYIKVWRSRVATWSQRHSTKTRRSWDISMGISYSFQHLISPGFVSARARDS